MTLRKPTRTEAALTAELRAAQEARMLADAERDAALDALAAVRAFVRRNAGYMSPEDQQIMRDADATLAARPLPTVTVASQRRRY